MKIAVTGWYGQGSIGDELLMCAVARSVATGIPDADVRILSTTPDAAARASGYPAAPAFIPVDDFASLRSVARLLAFAVKTRGRPLALLPGLRAVVIGGGNLLSDRHPGNLETWRRQVRLYKALGASVYFYGISVGPLRNAASLDVVRDVLMLADGSSFRDRRSLELMRPMLPAERLIQSADPVLSLVEPQQKPLDVWPPKRSLRIGFNVRHISSVATARAEDAGQALTLGLLRSLDATLHFVPMNVRDLPVAQAIKDRLPSREAARFVVEPYAWGRPDEHMRRYDELDAFVSMRLHSAVVAALHGIPVIGLDGNPKIPGFLGEIGLGDFVSAVSDGIGTYAIDVDDVVTKTCQLIAEWPGIREQTLHRLRELRARERRNLDGLRAVLGVSPAPMSLAAR